MPAWKLRESGLLASSRQRHANGFLPVRESGAGGLNHAFLNATLLQRFFYRFLVALIRPTSDRLLADFRPTVDSFRELLVKLKI
jgi:hypothetical protein